MPHHSPRPDLRNICIIAHVDHGKTTLVDGMLKQSAALRRAEATGTLIMDSGDLEREKGITILAKNTAVVYRGVTINIIDTPGHADFGGEVERVLNMADGALLLIDAVEGPMPQTRFVLKKAFEIGLRPIVIINKIDRPMARIAEVLSRTQDLFLELATEEEQLDFPVLYAVGREGIATTDPEVPGTSLQPLFEAILRHVPAPAVDPDGPFQMLVTTLGYDNYQGRLCIGRIARGHVAAGDAVVHIDRQGVERRAKIANVYITRGLERVAVERATAGDIVALTGIAEAGLGDTIASVDAPESLPPIAVEEPTVKMTFGVNTSPFAGRDGQYVTSRQLRERLLRELETNLALRVEDTESADTLQVSGRGELHLAILIETMRREGYEFQVSRPEVIAREVNGHLTEPVEHLVIDTREEYVGVLTESLGRRLAEMVNLQNDGAGNVRLEYTIPTRGLIGFRNYFLTATRGNGIMASIFIGYEPWYGTMAATRNGALVASETGTALTYGLVNAQERGSLFIEPGTEVYQGMIVGLHIREDDLAVNVCKAKQKTNIRSSTQEIQVRLTPATILSLEQSLDFIGDDELVEVTPRSLRLRKRLLDPNDRARARKLAALGKV
ncbi:MAG TPA: translational GTPase TypA [Chloroflexota bacterium]|nr:translational GTPase TypA [Chloroflexota bacterium]